MLTLIFLFVAVLVAAYFYMTRPAFKAWVKKVWVALVAAAVAVGAAIAAWWDQLPSFGG